jgi:glycerol-1-phosphate dehydrogenase [NAD(P)+]
LQGFLISAPDMQAMLERAGVVTDPLEVDIDRDQHKQTVLESRLIRRRYTVLDLLHDVGLLDAAVDATFAANGYWGGRKLS